MIEISADNINKQFNVQSSMQDIIVSLLEAIIFLFRLVK